MESKGVKNGAWADEIHMEILAKSLANGVSAWQTALPSFLPNEFFEKPLIFKGLRPLITRF